VIFSHGNASDLGDVYYYGERLCYEYGFDFVAYDYTGYGLGLGR
jgi:pimeloyl-ACP methyl ester carboxylesterase